MRENIYLGSGSPRRFDLLTQAGIKFTKRSIDVEENYPDDTQTESIAEYLAEKKAQVHLDLLSEKDMVITADTIVVQDGVVYGKPIDKNGALKTLMTLSDNVHDVYTGVCLISLDKKISFTEKSEVCFGKITEQEALDYIDKFSPMDKAGAYGIQDWIGFTRILWIKGSYSNILGLPMAQVWDKLKTF